MAVMLALIVKSSVAKLPCAAKVIFPPALLTTAEVMVRGLAAVMTMLPLPLLMVTPDRVLTVVILSAPVFLIQMLPVWFTAARLETVVSSASATPMPV